MTDFVIPVAKADLLKRTTSNAYVVNDVISLRNLRSQLPKCQRVLISEGHLSVIRTFDTYFSVLHEWHNVDFTVKEDAWSTVIRGCEVCVHQLVSLLEKNEVERLSLNSNELSAHRNALKMHTYLLCQFVDMFENELNANAKSNAVTKLGRGRGRGTRRVNATVDHTPGSSDLNMNWIDECEKAITVLDQICRLQIDKLWDPPVAEEDFVNLLANCCYKLLENRTMASGVNMRLAISRLLATLIRRYGHSIACSVKLAQLLQCFPHMVNCLLSVVRSFIEDENVTGVVRELLKEICSYSGSDLERDAQATQNFSNFLQEVAAAYPSLAQSMLPLLRTRLDEDPYQMRNCALGVIGEILPAFARRENLDQKERVQRDRLMDLLQEHIHDVNGYVRAKALQIWYNIVTTGGLPIRRQSQLAALLVGNMGAMMDVSSLARKYACKTLTAMVLQSPAAKLTPDELQQVLNKEMKRLEGLEDLLAKVSTMDDDISTSEGIAVSDTNTNTPIRRRPKATDAQKSKRDSNTSTITIDDTGEHVDNDSNNDCDDKLVNTEEDDNELETLMEDSTITLCPTAELDAAAALEAAIHTAAAIATCQTPSASESDLPPTMRSTTVAQAELNTEVVRQKACVTYLCETSAFSKLIQTAITDFHSMLASKTLTDITEAIDFFVVAKQAGVKGLEAGIRQLFIQIWSQDEPIRKAVVEAFRKLYLQSDSDEPAHSNNEPLSFDVADTIATNLSMFIRQSQMGDLVSVERIVGQLISSDQFNKSLIDHIWNRFVRSANQTDKDHIEDVKSMLLIIKMVVRPGEKEIGLRLDDLMKYGLEPITFSDSTPYIDLERVRFACEVIRRMVPQSESSTKTTKSTSPLRLPFTHCLFNRLKSIILSTMSEVKHVLWIPMMEQAVGVIYDLSECPDIMMISMIKLAAEKLFYHRLPYTNTENNQAQNAIDAVVLSQCDQENRPPSAFQYKLDPEREISSSAPAFLLSRFLALIGHVALKQLVHLESSVLSELKRRATVKEECDAKHKSKSRRNNHTTVKQTVTNSTLDSSSGQNVDDESGLIGVAADDTEADYIRQICDQELFKSPDHIFTPLLNAITYVCTNPNRFTDSAVQASASLALAKLMLINAEVCEPHLQLLFTIAERNPSDVVRANLVVALGDLCRRFPNLIEPWTPNLYARLRDTSAKVRINALNTLSHLILNDMVKVKGQISEMTVSLVDEISRLNVLARRFFRELSQKGNALYNVMPDIISRLSDPNIGVNEEHFHSIIDFLMPLILKERLCETLVEKICARFRTTSLERQWRDLSHCLTVLPINDRIVHVLYENLPAFANKLCVTEVYAAFECILSNAKKSSKPDSLTKLEEFEAKLKEFHEKGVADEAALHRAEVAARNLKHRGRNHRTTVSQGGTADISKRNTRKIVKTRNVPSYEENVSQTTNNASGHSNHRARRRIVNKKIVAAFSSEEDDSPDRLDDSQ